MALGYLFIMFIVMSVLAVVGAVLLFLVKKERVSDILLILMAAYSVVVAYLGATAQPINFIGPQVLAWAVGLVAVVGVGVRFISKKQLLVSKLMVAGSVIVGIYLLYFG